MCHRFTPLVGDEVDRVIGYLQAVRRALVEGACLEEALPRLAPAGSVPWEALDCFPGSPCEVVVAEDDVLKKQETIWGVAVEWRRGLVFNARLESALRGEGLWREATETGRCLVPVRAFYETRNVEPPSDQPSLTLDASGSASKGSRKPQYRFTSPADEALLLAGLVVEGNRLAVVTTEPNALMAPIHNRMPLVLSAQEAWTWLEGVPEAQALLADRAQVDLAVQELPAPDKTKRGGAVSDPGADQLSLF